MARPVLIAASDNTDDLVVIDSELTRRYGADYEVVCESSADSALAALERFDRQDRRVAVVLADLRISGDRGPEVLSRAGALHPGAKRGLVIPWGDRSVAEVVLRGAALGEIDFWTLKPWQSPDEQFNAMVGEALRSGQVQLSRSWRSCAWWDSSGRRARTRSEICWHATPSPMASTKPALIGVAR